MTRTDAERLVLGDLSEEERARFEDRLLAEDALFDEVRAAESDLLDDYVRGGLAPAERKALESRVLATPAGQDRLRFARLLQAAITVRARDSDSRRRAAAWPVPVWALAAAAVLAMAAAVLVQREVAGLRSEIADLRRLPTPPGVKPPEPRAVPPVRMAFALGAGALRSEGRVRLRLPPAVDVVALGVDLEGASAYSRLRAILRTEDGIEVSAHDVPAPRDEGAASLVIDVRAALLAAGDYVLTFDGVRDGPREVLGAFPFRIVRSAGGGKPPSAAPTAAPEGR